LDIYKKRVLSELLKYISDVDGIEWIRLHYAFPSGFPLDILDVMRERNNICKYLDMPLQHINDRILNSMLRGTTRQKTIELIDSIRNRVPGIALRTTLITGYPGETEKEFEELKKWVKDARFERLGVFTYSHEENTTAYNLTDDVPQETKEKRAGEIMEIQKEISFGMNKSRIGQSLKVLIDKKESEYFIGRTEYDSPEVDNEVLVKASSGYAGIGDFANVKITDASEYDLFGELEVT
jgi:ribosomal protein S12 methylthiotransferase